MGHEPEADNLLSSSGQLAKGRLRCGLIAACAPAAGLSIRLLRRGCMAKCAVCWRAVPHQCCGRLPALGSTWNSCVPVANCMPAYVLYLLQPACHPPLVPAAQVACCLGAHSMQPVSTAQYALQHAQTSPHLTAALPQGSNAPLPCCPPSGQDLFTALPCLSSMRPVAGHNMHAHHNSCSAIDLQKSAHVTLLFVTSGQAHPVRPVLPQVIEAHYLFGVDYDNIDIVIHPQSIIHSMVETADSSVLAQVRLMLSLIAFLLMEGSRLQLQARQAFRRQAMGSAFALVGHGIMALLTTANAWRLLLLVVQGVCYPYCQLHIFACAARLPCAQGLGSWAIAALQH